MSTNQKTLMSEPRIIFADGVVACGRKDDARILSSRNGDVISLNSSTISASNEIWGEWHQDNAYREIRLSLTISGQQILEGEGDFEP
jgi:hypothetical protein